MAKALLLIFLFLPLTGWGDLYLKERLAIANPGDFVVTCQKKTFTLWSIRHKNESQVLIEEISVPSSYLKLGADSWKGWVGNKAPGHTTWLLYAIDLQSSRLQSLYSFDQQAWCQTDQSGNFLTSLLNLSFEEIPLSMRRKVGPATSRQDNRPYWNPHLVFEGEEIQGVHFDQFQAKWPRDGSELSDRSIDIYLPSKDSPYPSYFPYWLQVSGNMANAKIRVIDSGTHLRSPMMLPVSYQHSPNTPAPLAVINNN